MFSAYTWSSFFSFLGLMGFIYFLIVGYAFYKRDITHFLFFKRSQLQDAIESPVKKPDLLPMVHELVSELGLVIRQASENNPALPELLFALKSKIKEFMLLEPTEYKGKINLYISQELEIHGLHSIESEDIENLWKS